MTADTKWPAGFVERLRVTPGSKVVLPDGFGPGDRFGLHRKDEGARLLQRGVELLADYQDRLAAQHTDSVLVVLQGMDASGKDSTIRHVMNGVNPQGVHVSTFKEPSAGELDHDYLWRHERRLPARGEIGIFNRSHYEEVLVVRVHPENLAREQLPPECTGPDIWNRRYREINDWERYLAGNGIRLVKLFLNVSREKQRIRFLRRIERPEKNWKFSASDVRERRYWDDYQRAYSTMLTHTSTEWAPWYVLPADHKWVTRLCAAAVIGQTLIDIDPRYPVPDEAARQELLQARAELEAEARALPSDTRGPGRMSDVHVLDDGAPVTDPLAPYAQVDRTRAAGGCWVMANMVGGLDGSAAIGGRVAALSTEPDAALFRLMRALADVVLVGAETVRREGYRRLRLPEERAAARQAAGRPGRPGWRWSRGRWTSTGPPRRSPGHRRRAGRW